MIRELEVNSEYRKNPRAPLWHIPNSPLASTEQEQYAWALNDYYHNLSKANTVFPAYMTEGYTDLDAVNRAERNAAKGLGWFAGPALGMVGGINEIKKQDQAHRFYNMPVVHGTMENTRKELEKKIYGDLKKAIIHKELGVRYPSMQEATEEELVNSYPLEKRFVDNYLHNWFGN